MSTFFFEDTVAFKADKSIIGTIECTWNDVDRDTSGGKEICYVHKNLPSNVKDAWFDNEELLPGFVIVEFLRDYDGYCLVPESSLDLADRSLAVGDVVKKMPLDVQSGTVISTSLVCGLQSLCSDHDYNTKETIPAVGHTPSYGPNAPQHKSKRYRLLHGSPRTTHSRAISPPRRQSTIAKSILQVSAQELTHWNDFREEDFIIYKDWVGRVRSTFNEVTIRLTNGSVVIVEDPDELEEPYWIPGTASYELAQRLDRAGYYIAKYVNQSVGKAQSIPAEPYYPGQHVQTKKGNLRRGRWKFGAYDPSVPPEGIVADVRCLELDIRWLYPNQSLSLRGQGNPPPNSLELDELQSGEIVVYCRSRLPINRTASLLSNASYAPDTGYGHRVRFRDPAGAAIKYGNKAIDPNPSLRSSTANPDSQLTAAHCWERIPRAATQGYDMNVFQIISTSTKAIIRWQDGSMSEEVSVQLHPYLNPDEHDVWPGDKVSLKAEEQTLAGDSAGSVRAHKVGVVQRVDAAERIAEVRWFHDAKIDMDEEKSWQIHGSKYGNLGDELTELPLYDIAAHQAIMTNLGDLAVILPVTDTNPPDAGNGFRSALSSLLSPMADFDEVSRNVWEPDSANPAPSSMAPGVEWFGEITDVCLDGEVIVRLGAAHQPRDVKFPPERILAVASDDIENDTEDTDDEDDDDEDWSDEMAISDAGTDHDTDPTSTIKISYEYEGGEKLTTDNDEEMWSTDDEDISNPNLPAPVGEDSTVPPRIEAPGWKVSETSQDYANGKVTLYSHYSSMPAQFAVLDSSLPTDHHYIDVRRPLTADLMRRVMKENDIIRDSLPDGVFVRSWDSRLDLLRVLIVGSQGTPYEFAPFVIDLQYGLSFPVSSPDAYFHSWTNNVGRVNPNLYEDGKICLSLLGTWNGENRNEEWSSKKSTVLQLIVSLMGLVLVREPYYNEAGFDVLIGSAESQIPSALYNEKVYVMSKAFVKTALSNLPQGLEDVITWLYLAPPSQGPNLLRLVIEDSRRLLPENTTVTDTSGESKITEQPSRSTKLSSGALILLRRHLACLEDFIKRNEEQRVVAGPFSEISDKTALSS